MKLRADYKDVFVEKHGVKLGLMSGFVKVLLICSVFATPWSCLFSDSSISFQAAVCALQHQPVINGVIDGDDIIYRDYIDISMAVGTSKVCILSVYNYF